MGIVKNLLYKFSSRRLVFAFKNQSIFPYYHIINDKKVSHIENLYRYKNEEQFRQDLDFLLANYKPIDPKLLLTQEIPKNSFLLTFDDGLREIYSVVYPILKEKGIRAIFFLNPNFIDNNDSLYKHDISIIISHLKDINFNRDSLDQIASILSFSFNTKSEFIKLLKSTPYKNRRKIKDVLDYLNIDIKQYLNKTKPYITKEEVQEMIDSGFYVGGHTMSHPPLDQLSYEDQKSEIINSIDWLKNIFNIDYSFFAFPFSDRSASRLLINELFAYDNNIRLFGNSGVKKDIDTRIIQRFSLEHPDKEGSKQVITENLYSYFNKSIGKYSITRK